MLTHPQLMARIEQYSFDNPAINNIQLSFRDRLCVETGWRKPFADGAIREYRRFVYLAVTGDRPVTPSREVDAVWHLHLIYTRSYWERLHALLPRPLHHEPTPGSKIAAGTYRTQYADTTARYQAEFGEAPPEAYWPPEDERFQPDMRKMRGQLTDAEMRCGAGDNVKTKPTNWTATAFAALAVAGAAGLIATATPAFAADGVWDNGVAVIAVVIAAVLFLFAFSIMQGVNKTAMTKKRGTSSDGGSYIGGDVGSSSGGRGGKGDKDDADGGEQGGEGSGGEGSGGDGGGGGCGGGCGS